MPNIRKDLLLFCNTHNHGGTPEYKRSRRRRRKTKEPDVETLGTDFLIGADHLFRRGFCILRKVYGDEPVVIIAALEQDHVRRYLLPLLPNPWRWSRRGRRRRRIKRNPCQREGSRFAEYRHRWWGKGSGFLEKRRGWDAGYIRWKITVERRDGRQGPPESERLERHRWFWGGREKGSGFC